MHTHDNPLLDQLLLSFNHIGYVWSRFFVLCFSNLYLGVLKNCFQIQYLSKFKYQKFVWQMFST
jgi:hypothetical protein